MIILNICVNALRILLITLIIFYTFKRNRKLIISASVVFILTFLLPILNMIFGLKVDLAGVVIYYAIIFSAIFLGSGYKFYDKFSWWDIMIHSMSGIVFVSLGIALTSNTEGLSKMNILFFCLTLSVFLHVVWEIAEYITDCILHANNQRWQKIHNSVNHKSESAVQPAGLVDTMNDTIICLSSALIACTVWWFIL